MKRRYAVTALVVTALVVVALVVVALVAQPASLELEREYPLVFAEGLVLNDDMTPKGLYRDWLLPAEEADALEDSLRDLRRYSFELGWIVAEWAAECRKDNTHDRECAQAVLYAGSDSLPPRAFGRHPAASVEP